MNRLILVMPAIILLIIGGIVATGAVTQTTTKVIDQPNNFDNLVFVNNNGYDQSGLPTYTNGGGFEVLQFHLDISTYAGTSEQVATWRILSSDWSANITSGALTWNGAPATYTIDVPQLAVGTYILVISLGGQPLYWQHFSITNASPYYELGGGTILIGIIFLIAGVWPSRRYH